MKFYLREYQDIWNTDDKSPGFIRYAQRISRKQDKLRATYLRQLSAIRDRLQDRTYRLLSGKDPLFDSKLMGYSIGDSVRTSTKTGPEQWYSTEAEVRLITFEEDAIYTLRYRGVRTSAFDLPKDRWYGTCWYQIDSLLAHEVLPKGPEFLTHEFLFASGATIKIEFKKLDFAIERVERWSVKTRHLRENLERK